MASLLRRLARKLVRPPLALYDRLLGGRAFPGAGTLDRQVARLEAWVGGGNVPLPKERWEAEYGNGVWDYLAGDEEAVRYRTIAGLMERLGPSGAAGSVLDVGCGEGLLLDFLPPASERGRYTGIDLSEHAIETALGKRGDGAARFLVADAETWDASSERFDAIVLNECLYYFHEPLATFERYLGWLGPGGILIVSMYEAPRTVAIARTVGRRHPPVTTTRLEGPPGAWLVSVHQPAPETGRRGRAEQVQGTQTR